MDRISSVAQMPTSIRNNIDMNVPDRRWHGVTTMFQPLRCLFSTRFSHTEPPPVRPFDAPVTSTEHTPVCRTDARMRNHVSGVGRDEEVDEDLFSGSGVVTD